MPLEGEVGETLADPLDDDELPFLALLVAPVTSGVLVTVTTSPPAPVVVAITTGAPVVPAVVTTTSPAGAVSSAPVSAPASVVPVAAGAAADEDAGVPAVASVSVAAVEVPDEVERVEVAAPPVDTGDTLGVGSAIPLQYDVQ